MLQYIGLILIEKAYMILESFLVEHY